MVLTALSFGDTLWGHPSLLYQDPSDQQYKWEELWGMSAQSCLERSSLCVILISFLFPDAIWIAYIRGHGRVHWKYLAFLQTGILFPARHDLQFRKFECQSVETKQHNKTCVNVLGDRGIFDLELGYCYISFHCTKDKLLGVMKRKAFWWAKYSS